MEVYRIDALQRDDQPFENHHMVTASTTSRIESRRVEAGTLLVRTGQALGSLAAYLLEPGSEDGLCAWNFLDGALEEGGDYPIARLRSPVPLILRPVTALPEDREKGKRITFETIYGDGDRPDFGGSPVSGIRWLEDGEHFLQVKDGIARKVDAATGRSEPFYDRESLAEALRSLPTIDEESARSMSRRRSLHFNEQRDGALFVHENDLYYASLDGAEAVRLTETPAGEELATFSPDGQFVAFHREHDLFVVDIASRSERALTTGGTELISNGKADWVYMEEVYGRGRPKTFWWDPTSTRIAFLQFDDAPVSRFTVIDQIPTRQEVESTAYPKAGDPNPKVRLGVVTAAGGPVRWIDLGSYLEGSFLITRVGWLPGGESIYFYVQDRAQTWLDFNVVPSEGGRPERLFRETTGAWVANPGEAHFLDDGSFLLLSERTGWKHIYRFDEDGSLRAQVTDGAWEVRRIDLVDEDSGLIYFTATRDSHIAHNLYRIELDGTGLERLTVSPGHHRVNLSPKGNYFIDTWSDIKTPRRVRLYRTDGTPSRDLDTNPAGAIEEYRLGVYEQFQIETSDGFALEASLLKPADFDPDRQYPVWFMTYGGPHAPQIRNDWSGGRVRDQMLAELGFIVFRCDPRSASGKGAESAWTAYRQLGVQEMRDIEEAIAWLSALAYVDAERIGMSGHSYGGFMTVYAMTHSQLFAAGIAGAPVTDWRNYDTIYTERYMGIPQDNPEGYERASVVEVAGDLHGRLLILHGVRDDNVHLQNTLQFVQALQEAGKDFEMMLYPGSRHGLGGTHYQRLMIDFMTRSLGLANGRGGATN
ncbi:S9 family peptidase [Candidatus Sumerlaeota bacterium]|nr:S9 family peptidase [Candidatus Sumerlaeota bacterium]